MTTMHFIVLHKSHNVKVQMSGMEIKLCTYCTINNTCQGTEKK